MEAAIVRGLSGLDPSDLECGDQEALAELIATYFDDNNKAIEGQWQNKLISSSTVYLIDVPTL